MSSENYISAEGLEIIETGHPTCRRLVFCRPEGAETDWHFQLYCNGQFVDSTDTPGQLWFDVHTEAYCQQFAVIAVRPENRLVDYESELSEDLQPPQWIFTASVSSDSDYYPGDVLAVYHDDASGELQSSAAWRKKIYPPAKPHIGWGVSSLVDGGFGIDGSNALGLRAPFGDGPMGLGSEHLDVVLPLTMAGDHRIVMRVISESSEVSDDYETSFSSYPPPERAPQIELDSYDAATRHIVISLNV